MEIYLIKSAACLALLMLFYKILLEKENMHVFKRYYLLLAIPFSTAIPSIIFTKYIEASSTISEQDGELLSSSVPVEEVVNWIPHILWGLYLIGLIFFGIKFILNLEDLLYKIKKNPKIENEGTTNVLLEEDLPPHTFWSYIFLNRQKYQKREIPEEVFEHEQAHARQKHSLDVLLVEFFQVIFWFYPVMYVLKKAVKLNHEFLADQAVLKKGIERSRYQQTLLLFSSKGLHSNLVNPISYSSIRKRFIVMKAKKSKKAILIRAFLLGPLLLALLYSFSTTKTVQVPSQNSEVSYKMMEQKVTPSMMKEYEELVTNFDRRGISQEETNTTSFKRMRYIFSQMDQQQKEVAVPMPPVAPVVSDYNELSPPPPPTPSHIDAVKARIKQGAQFYLNGKKISGEEALELVQEKDGIDLNVQVKETGARTVVLFSLDKIN